MLFYGVLIGRYLIVPPYFFIPSVWIKGGETMLESDKYAYVSIGGGVESVYIRIKKDTLIPETDRAKLIAWAQEKGFPVSAKKRILHAE